MGVFTSKGIGELNTRTKSIVSAAIVAVIIGIFVGCEEAYTPTPKEALKASAPTSTEIEALREDIKKLVKGLEYSDEVAEDFVKTVIGWKDAQGQPVLAVWKKRLAKAKEARKQDKAYEVSLARIEESIVKELALIIEKEVNPGPDHFFDLSDVIKHKQAQCLSYSLLIYTSGNSIGLSVEGIDVADLPIPGLLPRGASHTACLVSLADDTKMMVDLLSLPKTLSERFIIEQHFVRVGNYWELKQKHNNLGVHRRFRILDKNGLIAEIYNNRGVYGEPGVKAIRNFDKAVELDPIYAGAYYNRGVHYLALGEYTDALLSFDRSTELDPKAPCPHFTRGVACAHLKKFNEAIRSYTTAIKIDKQYAQAYAERGAVFGFLKNPIEAKRDLRMAVELDPTLKAYVEMLSDRFKLGLKFD